MNLPPGGMPPSLMAAGYAPQYGMPHTGTPIGLPGPPHIPLGAPAGLKRHVIKNHTRMSIPDPTSNVKIHVKQRPGLSYPQPANRARIVEETIHPQVSYPYRHFGVQPNSLINLIVRADVKGRLFHWLPNGEQLAHGETEYLDKALWVWASNRVNMNQIRVVHGWANSVPSRRALVIPVWRTAPSAENPKPDNEFNGVLALVIDLNRFVEVYPAKRNTGIFGGRPQRHIDLSARVQTDPGGTNSRFDCSLSQHRSPLHPDCHPGLDALAAGRQNNRIFVSKYQ